MGGRERRRREGREEERRREQRVPLIHTFSSVFFPSFLPSVLPSSFFPLPLSLLSLSPPIPSNALSDAAGGAGVVAVVGADVDVTGFC